VTVSRSLPHAVREIEHCWVPMADGARLAARLWLPEGVEGPVPAILEYIPYRKRDFMRARDETIHAWFAGQGYAAVRVDVRGTGDSDGLLADEYSEQEVDDALAAIAWIVAQPWCSGAVGMLGKSWGGISALRVAARRPPALRAVVTVCSTDDRWTDDAHYMGGCLLNENLTWGTTLMALAALPPDPAIVGESWRATWRARLDGLVPFPALWMAHPRRDAYWRRGCEDLSQITCPVYAVGGWADAYTSAVPRLLAGLGGPRKGLIGPWAHVYPYAGRPGPPIHFLGEALRWWDQWLRGIETGVMFEPMLRVWMQEGIPPTQPDAPRAGRWVAEPEWPSTRITLQRWALGRGLLAPDQARPERIEYREEATVGLAAGDWCDFGGPAEAPGDQQEDDRRSYAFDSPPLAKRIEILGAPAVTLELSVDRPAAQLAVRLNDVTPEGGSTRVTYGLFDLTQLDGEPLVPGKRVRVRLQLRDAAHAFAAGHRIRVAVSTGYWPIAWPAPEPVTLSLFTGASRLELPARPPREADAELRRFAPPESAPLPALVELSSSRATRMIDDRGDTSVYRVENEGGVSGRGGPCRIVATGVELASALTRDYRLRRGDPLSATAEVVQRTELRGEGFDVVIEVRSRLTATGEAFRFEADVRAEEVGAEVRTHRFDLLLPR
jgi:putative CocE/NonD family hydrolase